MPVPIQLYVKYVEAATRAVGRVVMYLILVLMGMLLFSSITRGLFNISFIWVVEMSQFMLSAYYILGGGYSLQIGAHVRMDLFYGRASPKGQAWIDATTSVCVIFYLIVLLIGGISSTEYALTYGQKNYSAWAPPLAPIKIIMVIGIVLMLLQVTAVFFRDLAQARGRPLP